MIDTRQKIVSADQAATAGETIVAVGRFDVIRAEHCRALQQARSGCARLIAVVLADSEDAVSLLDQQSRAQLTAALASVDQVVVGSLAEAQRLAARLAATLLDVDSLLERDLVADVLKRQSATA